MKHRKAKTGISFGHYLLGTALVLSPILVPWAANATKDRLFAVNDPNAVTVTMVSPTEGSTVSGTIQLACTAGSTAGPIKRVEFYVDQTNLIAIVDGNNRPIPLPPKAVTVR